MTGTDKNIYDFSSGSELLELCKVHSASVGEIMLRRECIFSSISRETALAEMNKNLTVMRESVTEGLREKQSSVTGYTGGDAELLMKYAARSYMGMDMCKMVAGAISVVEVNSAMGKIVAAPTAGASGVLPGCLIGAAEKHGFSDDDLVLALFTAAALGMLIARNATLAGAEGGCQAEVGSAAAMTAAALVELKGGSPLKALTAAAIAIKNIMGLVCDPVAGLVECPCVKRNAMGSANAALCADLALAGVKSLIPFDEVVSAMKSVGRLMNVDLKETSKGGLAATPTGKMLINKLRENADE